MKKSELGDGEPSPPPDTKAAKLSAELKASRTAWHMSYGVPVSAEHARFMFAIGAVTDFLDASVSSSELAAAIVRELYDRFVMGGWEPKDAYPLIESWLRESGAAQEVSPPSPDTVCSKCGKPKFGPWTTDGPKFRGIADKD